MTPKITTLGEKLFWSYANLAMAHSAVAKGAESYGRTQFMIRAKLFKGLCDGTMNVGSLIEEDRLKMSLPKACAYCGENTRLTLDHLMPKCLGGPETGDNIVWACRSCNSGKQGKDLLKWYEDRGEFPPLLLLRRYLKLGIEWTTKESLLDHPLETVPENLPFDPDAVPRVYPSPSTLRLWVR